MITDSKVIELFCMADDFCIFLMHGKKSISKCKITKLI